MLIALQIELNLNLTVDQCAVSISQKAKFISEEVK